MDHIFSPGILTKYTWTGVSRKKDIEKLAFNALEGIIEVFFKVIYAADDHHTVKKNESFFKDHVLKHALKRSFRKWYFLLK